MVRCKVCGRPFPSELQVDRATLEALVLAERYSCPQCGCEAVYTKADHFHILQAD